MKRYDVIIVGAGPGGIFSAYELTKKDSDLKIAVFETGTSLEKRKCPIDGKKVKSCVGCKTCAIMNGFGGAGAFQTESTILPTSSAAICMNISASRKHWI